MKNNLQDTQPTRSVLKRRRAEKIAETAITVLTILAIIAFAFGWYLENNIAGNEGMFFQGMIVSVAILAIAFVIGVITRIVLRER